MQFALAQLVAALITSGMVFRSTLKEMWRKQVLESAGVRVLPDRPRHITDEDGIDLVRCMRCVRCCDCGLHGLPGDGDSSFSFSEMW